MSSNSIIQQWEARKASFLSDVHTRLMRESYTRHFACLRPSGPGQWGELLIITDGEETPDGCELVTPEHIPQGDPLRLQQWFERFANRLPILPY